MMASKWLPFLNDKFLQMISNIWSKVELLIDFKIYDE